MKLSEEVKELEKIVEARKQCECGQLRATLNVNFGEKGRTMQGVIKDSLSIHGMMMEVLNQYHDDRNKCLETLKLITELPEHGRHCAKKMAAQCYTMVSQGLTIEDLNEDEQG